VADLGVFVPLVAALVVVNGLDPGAILIAAGILLIAAGTAFRIPFPVQPLKALTALAVAKGLAPEMIHSAGLMIGAILVALSVTGLVRPLARLFTTPVIRSLQFAVGILLIVTAARLAGAPPEVFTSAPAPTWSLALATVTAAVVGIAAWRRVPWLGAAVFVIGVVVGWMAMAPAVGGVTIQLPSPVSPDWSVFASAFVVLVIPQLPLTFGNAVVGVSHLAHELYDTRAARVTPGRVALSTGLGNVGSALVGGVPMCHGSSGLSAHARLGARSAFMNLLLGGFMITLGVVFADQVLTIFGVLPVWALAGFLAYAGLRHAMLVLDLRGVRLLVALGAGGVGIVTGNLAITTALALAADQVARLAARSRSDG
jgi:sulfate permease, SulP family